MSRRAVLAMAAAAGAFLAGDPGRAAAPTAEALRPVVDLIETVKEHYVGDKPYTSRALADEALKGMVRNLDRYSEYLDRQQFKDLQEDTRGSFGGVGIAIGIVSGNLQVIAPIEGTPADRAGLQGGDIIAYIDGYPTDGIKIMDAVHRIKGPPGTKVTLTILREGEGFHDVVLTRAQITPVNIRHRIMEDTGYVTIRSFSQHTAEKLRKVLEEFEAERVEGVILDLRDNPGGLLKEAHAVTDLFLPGGKLIVSTEGRDPAQRARLESTGLERVRGVPMVVLTNEHSASASEIVAGALQDWGRAIVMGRRSFGKASVQSIQPLTRDQAQALRLTVAKYYTPKHHEIHEVGIEPDVTLSPIRSAGSLNRLVRNGQVAKFARELVAAPPSWLDPAKLKTGFLEPPPRHAGQGDVETRLGDEFRRWLNAEGVEVGEDDWDEIRSMAVERIRIDVMRRAEGDEAARRFAVTFDPQVAAARALLSVIVSSTSN